MLVQCLPVHVHSDFIVCPIGRWEGRRVWRYMEPYRLRIGDMDLEIPRFFQTDFASIPMNIIGVPELFGDSGQEGAGSHDYLYRCDSFVIVNGEKQSVSKQLADQIFYSLMCHYNDPPKEWKRQAMYIAVRDFGMPSFHQKNVADMLCAIPS